MNKEVLRKKLNDKGLKVTPQRLAVLEAIQALGNHPATDKIIEYVKERNPNISVATVYKVLNVLVESGIIHRVETDTGEVRYDHITQKHFHLYNPQTGILKDYYDEEIERLLTEHFKKKNIPGFEVEDIKLQIVGRFKDTGRD